MAENKRNRRTTARQKQVQERKKIVWTVIILVILIGGFLIIRAVTNKEESQDVAAQQGDEQQQDTSESSDPPGRPELDVELLTVNEYSRPGIPLDQVNGIVIHYTANPGSTAMNNRDYFENLKDTHTAKVSSHFVVGLDGEIVQCIPTAERSYASNSRNSDTIAIECCHPDDSGVFNETTYDSVIHLTAWLCLKFGLSSDQVIRHYDITGKNCPKYYVDNPEQWDQFRADVETKMQELQ